MHYIGVDYYKRYSYIVVKNEDGEVERRGSAISAAIPLGTAVIEATRNWGLIYDWLEEILDDVCSGSPLEGQGYCRGQDQDR